MRTSNRIKVADHIAKLGFDIYEDDIRVVRGPKVKSDILECWSANCKKGGSKVLISSCYTLQQLSKGLKLDKNQDNTCLYGDFVAVPKLPVVKEYSPK